MSNPKNQPSKNSWRFLLGVCFAIIVFAVFIDPEGWLPSSSNKEDPVKQASSAADHDDEHDREPHQEHDEEHDREHEDEHGHDHADHNEAASIELSKNGLKNIGFEPFTIEPTRYDKRLTLPAIVVERPGRSQIHVTAPLTGLITEIFSVNGEAVTADQPLFEMRLTHEELVAAQREYLRTSENLAVVDREIERLKSLDAGVIAGRRVLEQEYEKQKLEASLRAESQAMLLHGLTEKQVAQIRDTGRLLKNITVHAPDHIHSEDNCVDDHPYQIQKLNVAPGEHVEVGQELAVLADHCELHLEGLAFEDDVPAIRQAAEAGRKISASLLVDDSPESTLNDLEILYVADQINPETRAFKFYLSLPNRVALDKTTPDGNRFVEWTYKPGQRMQLKVPIESWEDQFVLPTTAVVGEGAEAYVYRQEGDHFDQVSVQVLNRNRDAVVIADDGTLQKGDVIAGRGAYQLHLALKNKSGGGLDPHAGHNH
ncbi:efflux RND transporter periplasmic adaptor subunit [Bythopirellula goksoeyrii]|nr:efflux RND transporter periplasmic adaptor subunit [Bythopirellula goksoeyrii]